MQILRCDSFSVLIIDWLVHHVPFVLIDTDCQGASISAFTVLTLLTLY